MSLLKNIGRIGVSKKFSVQQKRAVIITNYLSVIVSTLIFLLIIYRVIFHINTPFSVFTFGICICITPLFLNRFKLHTLASIMICTLPVCYLWYTFIIMMTGNESALEVFSRYHGMRIYLLAIGIIPYLILDRKKPLLILITIAPVLFSVLFFNNIISLTKTGLSEYELLHSDHQLSAEYQLSMVRTLVSYLLISSGCLILQYIVYQNDKFNRQLIHDLKHKNELLLESQQKLNHINRTLETMVEEKTLHLKTKNEALIKYAYANAHHVRGPIARILGLIQISKLDNDSDYKWIFEQMKNETEQADGIVKNISKELNSLAYDEDVDKS